MMVLGLARSIDRSIPCERYFAGFRSIRQRKMALPSKSSNKKGNSAPSSKSVVSAAAAKDLWTSEESQGKELPNRRSRSVSAVSRSTDALGFSNKWDNPLYYCSTSSSPDSGNPVAFSGVSGGREGRAVSRGPCFRNYSSDHRSEYGRSLSRVDMRRRRRRLRPVSREHCGNSENKVKHDYDSALSSRENEISTFTPKGKKKTETTTTASEFDPSEQTRNLRTWTSQHPTSDSWDTSSLCMHARNWEDRISTSSFSEAEEAMMRPFIRGDLSAGSGAGGIYETVRSEVLRALSEIRNDLENAVWRKNHAVVTTGNILDIPTEFLNPEEIELDSYIKRGYATKLEQSQERARKLRADLAVEEQRAQELTKLVKEMILDPISDSHKSRPKRKACIERLRISRHLAEEAMNYFDECVSISTFDSSDFSSLEDPQPNSAGGNPTMGSSRFFPNEASAFLASHTADGHHEELNNQTPCSLSIAGSDLAMSSNCSSKDASLMHANDSHDDARALAKSGVHDIKRYVEEFGKELREGEELVKVKPSYIADDYDSNGSCERLLFDRVVYRNRIESGGLLVCNIRTS